MTSSSPSKDLPALYPIIDVRGDGGEDRTRARKLATALAAAGVSLVQLRSKVLAAGALAELAAALAAELAALSCRLIVNDRVDVSMAVGAAGVHLGDEDFPAEMARALLGRGAVVGYSTHSLEDVRRASQLPVDYLGFGPVFESPTKAGVRTPRGLQRLAEACSLARVPVVAIGGITVDRAPQAWAAGATSVAVISELERTADVAGLVARYRSAYSNRPSS